MNLVILATSTETKKEAENIAFTLVQERLIACAKWWPINSVYWWKGKMVKGGEYELFLVTQKSLFPMVERRLKELHSYSIPQLVAIPLSRLHEPYRTWVIKETFGQEVK